MDKAFEDIGGGLDGDIVSELRERLAALGQALLLHWRLDAELGHHRHRLGDALRELATIVKLPTALITEVKAVKAASDKARHEPLGDGGDGIHARKAFPENVDAPVFVPQGDLGFVQEADWDISWRLCTCGATFIPVYCDAAAAVPEADADGGAQEPEEQQFGAVEAAEAAVGQGDGGLATPFERPEFGAHPPDSEYAEGGAAEAGVSVTEAEVAIVQQMHAQTVGALNAKRTMKWSGLHPQPFKRKLARLERQGGPATEETNNDTSCKQQ